MHLTLHITITSDKIDLEIPDLALAIHLSNMVAYDPQRIKLLSYGKSENELKGEMGSDWTGFKGHAAFTRIFDPLASGPIFDYMVMELLLLKARDLAFPKRLGNAVPLLHNALEIKAEIQDYEHLSLGRRRELEYYLQDFQRTQRLWINGEDRTISPTWRAVQFWVGLFVRILIPALLLFGGFLSVFNRWGQDLSTFLGAALAWIVGAVLIYFLGTSFWLLVFRDRLPHGYLRYQLRSGGALLRRPSRWLADKLL